MREERILKSSYDVYLESKVIENKSDILAVILPGIGYTLDRPILDYSKKLCLELGYDVLPIEYGFQAARKEFDKEKFQIVVDETMELISMSLNEKYKKIIFIGKSIGTVIQRIIQKKIISEGSHKYIFINVYFTPVDKTVELGIDKESLVFTGTKDPLIKKGSVEIIEKMKNVNLVKIHNADHSLNIKGDVVNSTKIIMEVIQREKEYLSRNL
ncbi:alpha/beta family hydrolase [uncultured Clostridium sp.]|uniref:alpha/beta family hydrolase n=1 Tax=uncultured Clostridium sp. TaxID=59620 RepID=UPI0025D178DE|nr:alpha/beta family hydrolase [uncultured Clostridium sp.]